MNPTRVSALVLLGVLGLPLLACVVVVLADPGVETGLLRALAITFAVGALVTGAMFAFFLSREGRLAHDLGRLTLPDDDDR